MLINEAAAIGVTYTINNHEQASSYSSFSLSVRLGRIEIEIRCQSVRK